LNGVDADQKIVLASIEINIVEKTAMVASVLIAQYMRVKEVSCEHALL
jgi:hypothetical protein